MIKLYGLFQGNCSKILKIEFRKKQFYTILHPKLQDVIVIENRERKCLDAGIFLERCHQYKKIHFDLGTGDGKVVYKMAKENPDTFYIGVDSCADGMGGISWKVARKPSKGGGIKNLALVHSSVENMPECFADIADSITIFYPWAKLLKDMTAPEPTTIEKISRIGKKSTSLDLVINFHVFKNEHLKNKLGLLDLNDESIKQRLVPIYKQFFFQLIEKKVVTGASRDEVSSWGKHLSLGSQRELLKLKWLLKKDES